MGFFSDNGKKGDDEVVYTCVFETALFGFGKRCTGKICDNLDIVSEND